MVALCYSAGCWLSETSDFLCVISFVADVKDTVYENQS